MGGRTSTIRSNGFSFDLGPTFFLYPRVLEEIFHTVGRDLREEVELVRLDPQYRLIFGGGGELLATPDVERMERAIAALSPTDAASFRSFLDDNRLKLASFKTCLESPFRGWRDVLRWPILRLLPLLRPWLSLDRELARYFRDPRVRLAFSFQSKYLGMSPFKCPSLFSILSFLEYEYGVHHPIGGCGAVTRSDGPDRDVNWAARSGSMNPLRKILFERKRAVGVRTGERCYKADAVIVNADFGHAMTRLVPEPPSPPLDRPEDRVQAFFLLHVHDVPGDRGSFRSPRPSHHLYGRGLRAQPRGDRRAPRAVRGSLLLRSERLRHRSDAGAAWHEHALRSRSCDPPASERGLGEGARTAFVDVVLRQLRADWHPWRREPYSLRANRYSRRLGEQHQDLSRRDFQSRSQSWARCCILRPRNRFDDLERRLSGRRRNSSR